MRREKSVGRRGSNTPKSSWCTQHKWAAQPGSQGQLNKVSKCPQDTWLCPPSKASEHSTALCTQRVSLVQQHLTRSWGSPQAEANPVCEPGFTHCRHTILPLSALCICSKCKAATAASQSHCLLEGKKFSFLCKKDLKTELRTFSTS